MLLTHSGTGFSGLICAINDLSNLMMSKLQRARMAKLAPSTRVTSSRASRRPVSMRQIQRVNCERVGQSPLGELQDYLRGQLDQPGFIPGIHQSAAPKDLWGNVDADVGVGVRAEPVAHFGCHGIDHPVGKHTGKRSILHERDEVDGRDDAGRPLPAGERFRADTPTVAQRDGWQVL